MLRNVEEVKYVEKFTCGEFSLEGKEMMRIFFNRGLLQPLAGDNGWAFSIFSVGREACWLFSSHFSSAVNSGWSNVWNLRKSSLLWHFHRKGRGWGAFSKEEVNG